MTTQKNTDKRILGIDVGDQYIGLALGASELTMPLAPISRRDIDTAINEIAKVAFGNKVSKIIVGLPVLADGKPTEQTLKVKSFVKKLQTRIKLPLVFVNEFLSSKEALENAINTGISQKKRKHLDSLSAEIILRRYYADTPSKS